MPMAMENLAIAQHKNTLLYSTICGHGYQPEVQNFEPKDYVCLQQIVLITLDVTNNYVFLRVKKVLPSRVLLLKGRDGQVCKDHV